MKNQSYPIQLLQTIWKSTNKITGRRLNNAMQTGLKLAIESGMKFNTNDFDFIDKNFRFYWWGGNDGTMLGERYYAIACEYSNISAAISFELWKERKSFITDMVEYGQPGMGKRNKGRLAIRSKFWWNGERVTVTSFSENGTYLIACSYKNRNPNEYRNKIKHQYEITYKDLKDYRIELKKISEELKLSIPEVYQQIKGYTIQEVWEKIERK